MQSRIPQVFAGGADGVIKCIFFFRSELMIVLQMCTLAAAVNVYIYIYDSMIYLNNICIMYICV